VFAIKDNLTHPQSCRSVHAIGVGIHVCRLILVPKILVGFNLRRSSEANEEQTSVTELDVGINGVENESGALSPMDEAAMIPYDRTWPSDASRRMNFFRNRHSREQCTVAILCLDLRDSAGDLSKCGCKREVRHICSLGVDARRSGDQLPSAAAIWKANNPLAPPARL